MSEKHPRSERTMFPREYSEPLKGKRFEEAKAAELQRKRYDPSYLTRDEVATMDPSTREAPEVRGRIQYSQQDWPEHRAVASIALGPLEAGEGETTEQRSIAAEQAFGGGKVEG